MRVLCPVSVWRFSEAFPTTERNSITLPLGNYRVSVESRCFTITPTKEHSRPVLSKKHCTAKDWKHNQKSPWAADDGVDRDERSQRWKNMLQDPNVTKIEVKAEKMRLQTDR